MKLNEKLNAVWPILGAVLALTLPAQGQAPNQSDTLAEMQKQIKALQQQVETLKEGPPRDKVAEDLMGKGLFKADGLKIGFYGEAKYRMPEAGANQFDPHRFVLTPSYRFADWLVFNSELELEHGGLDESTNRGSRFNGELEVEQMYVDILINDHFNLRSFGIDLVPVGRINLYHEPTLFYSTERPELYREIIPSTWMEPGFGAFGKITDTLDYRVMVSTGLEDFSSSATGAGITAADGMRSARPRLRVANENSLAYSGRLHFNGIPGLDASASFYTTQVLGTNSQTSWVALWDVEALYRVPQTRLELRGDFAYWHIEKPGSFIANNDATANNNVGKRMFGWYGEAAYHFWPEAWRGGRGAHMDLVPFVRYSQVVTQSALPAGSPELDNGTANKDFLTAGVSYFLNANFVLKADWRRNLNGSTATKASATNQDYFQMGAGIFF